MVLAGHVTTLSRSTHPSSTALLLPLRPRSPLVLQVRLLNCPFDENADALATERPGHRREHSVTVRLDDDRPTDKSSCCG